jgi:undecaprenyl-diphosphatase
VHWCSDVLGGWLLGLAVVTVTAWAFEAWRTDVGRDRTAVAEGLEPEITREEPEPR